MAKIWVGAADCSFNNCGWSIIEHNTTSGTTKITVAGIIDNSSKIVPKGSKSLDDILRCGRLFEKIKDEPAAYYLKITGKKAFAVEMPGGSQSSRAASCLGMARGVIGSAIIDMVNSEIKKHIIVLVSPAQVHKKATGEIKATKEQIMDYVCAKYSEQIQVIKVKTSKRTIFRISTDCGSIDYSKGEFEHIADSLVIAELGLEKLKEEGKK